MYIGTWITPAFSDVIEHVSKLAYLIKVYIDSESMDFAYRIKAVQYQVAAKRGDYYSYEKHS